MQRRVFAVGHNLVGYLPESDVYFTDSFETAKGAMIEDLDRWGDQAFDAAGDGADEYSQSLRDEADSLSGVMEDLNLDNGPEWGTIIGHLSYWINDVTNDVQSDSERPLDELSDEEFEQLLDELNDRY